MENQEKTVGRFATELIRLMEEHDPPMSIKDLSDELGLTYEFVRKVVRGHNLPTKGSLIIMSKMFKVDIEVLQAMCDEDKLASSLGPDVAAIVFNPETKALVSGLAELDESAKKEVLNLLKSKLKEARKHPKH